MSHASYLLHSSSYWIFWFLWTNCKSVPYNSRQQISFRKMTSTAPTTTLTTTTTTPPTSPPVPEKQHALHALKKRMSFMVRRKQTVLDGLNAEFVNLRAQLDGISKSLDTLSNQIRTSRQDWTQVARHQAEFAAKLTSSLPQGGPVRVHATEVENRIRHVYRRLIEEDGAGSNHEKLTSILDIYDTKIKALEKEYPKIEMAYTETLRYNKKTASVESKKNPNHDKIHRNTSKYENAKNKYDGLIADIIPRMKEVLNKHEAVFQCAHHAFWLASNTYVTTIESATEEIRSESVAVQPQLLQIDISTREELPPIERVAMIEDGDANKQDESDEEEEDHVAVVKPDTRPADNLAEIKPAPRAIEAPQRTDIVVEQVDHDDHIPTDRTILPRVESASEPKKADTIVENEFNRTLNVEDILHNIGKDSPKYDLDTTTTKVDTSSEGPIAA